MDGLETGRVPSVGATTKGDEDVQSTKDEDGNPAHAAAGRFGGLKSLESIWW